MEKRADDTELPSASIAEFISLLTQFQHVERGVNVPGTERPENDSEHSYNLTMAAWFLIDTFKLPLDLGKVLRYALVHDWPEIYAGDAFALDPKQVALKDEKEARAREILAGQPITSGFSAVIEEYEKLDNDESCFVYGLDKLMAALTVLQDESSVWRDNGLTQKGWEQKFRAKIERSPYLTPWLEYVIQEQMKKPYLFAE